MFEQVLTRFSSQIIIIRIIYKCKNTNSMISKLLIFINFPIVINSLGCPPEWHGYMLHHKESAKCYLMSHGGAIWYNFLKTYQIKKFNFSSINKV